jgi:hypothetical protein
MVILLCDVIDRFPGDRCANLESARPVEAVVVAAIQASLAACRAARSSGFFHSA